MGKTLKIYNKKTRKIKVRRKLRKTYKKKRLRGGGGKNIDSDLKKFTDIKTYNLGELEDEINKKIDFTSFDNIDNNYIIEILVKEPVFYDIYRLQYKVDDKQTQKVILKVPLEDTLPNIYYEYIAGQYINTLTKQYPCFLQTYNYFKFVEGHANLDFNESLKDAIDTVMYNSSARSANKQTVDKPKDIVGKFFIEPKDSSIDSIYACQNPLGGGILIQYLPMIKSFSDLETILISSIKSDDKNEQQSKLIIKAFDFLCLFFQIYMPLAQLKDNFSHNNLTYDQVVVYVPYSNYKIIYNYKLPGGETVSFISEYMVKIKNYGTCYFNNTKSVSDEMQKNQCKNFVVPANDQSKDLSFYNDFLTMLNIDKKEKEKRKLYEGIINTLFRDFNKTKGVKTVQMLADHLKNKFKDNVFTDILKANQTAIESKDKKGIFGTLDIDMSGTNSPMMFKPHFIRA